MIAVLAAFGAAFGRSTSPAGEVPAAAFRIHIDPATGRTIVPTTPPPPASELPSATTSGVGLAVVPAPGGGVMIDLGGRFRSAMTSHVEPDGRTVTSCDAPGSGARGAAPAR